METTIFGPPGTGKTTRLISIVKEAIAGGIDPSRVAFMSFSKKAAEEAKTRALAELSLGPKDLMWFRTLHSLAFSWLGMRSQDVFKGRDFHDLGTLVGLDFRANASNNMSEGILFTPGSGGDKYMSMIQMARVREVSLEQQFSDSADYSLHFQQLRVLDKAYREFKEELKKRDFVDMIEDFIKQGTSPRFDLLIIDEAQDLAPLQWRMVKEVLVPNAKKVYYAGDDDQCIYSWMGVRVSDFLNASDHKIVLDKSYRVPLSVHNFSDQLVKRVAIRQNKVWQPTERQGNLSWHRDIMELDLENGEWLILARTNYIANKISTRLKEDGYLFWREGAGWSLSQNVLNGIEVWLKLCKGLSLSAAELKNFSKILNGNVITKSGRRNLESLDPDLFYTLDDIIERCSLSVNAKTPWMNVLKVSDKEIGYITSVRRRGERLLSGSPRIRISTIHKAKGGEADNVALFLDSTKACMESLDQDSEVRVFYVGATRTKKHLHLIESTGNYGFAI
jgi:superfamily I DNA/RNA helicase